MFSRGAHPRGTLRTDPQGLPHPPSSLPTLHTSARFPTIPSYTSFYLKNVHSHFAAVRSSWKAQSFIWKVLLGWEKHHGCHRWLIFTIDLRFKKKTSYFACSINKEYSPWASRTGFAEMRLQSVLLNFDIKKKHMWVYIQMLPPRRYKAGVRASKAWLHNIVFHGGVRNV